MIPDLKELGERFWANSAHAYAGWIPNVSGQLSFSIIGNGANSKGITSFNAIPIQRPGVFSTASPVRFIAAHQKRWTTDLPYRPRWSLRLTKPSAGVDYFIVGETAKAFVPVLGHENDAHESEIEKIDNAQGVLCGAIFVLLRNRRADRQSKNETFIGAAMNILWNRDGVDADGVKTKFTNLIAETRAETVTLFELKFALYRTGELRLWHEAGMGTGLKDDPLFEKLRFTLTKQAYYFVKDLVHRHYHHDEESDQFLALSPLPANAYDHDAGEVNWRRNTLWQLARSATDFRRQGRWHDLNKSLGILAYAEAFQRGFARSVRSANSATKFEPTRNIHLYDFEQLQESVRVSVDENQFRRTAAWQALTLFLATLFSLFALISNSLSALRDSCLSAEVLSQKIVIACAKQTPGYLAFAQIYVVQYFWIICIIAAVAMTFLHHMILRDRPPSDFWPFRKFSQSVALSRDLTGATIMSISTRIGRLRSMRTVSPEILEVITAAAISISVLATLVILVYFLPRHTLPLPL